MRHFILLLFVLILLPGEAGAASVIRTEIDIAKQAERIHNNFGWVDSRKYRMSKSGNVCASICYSLYPTGNALGRAGGQYADYYGSAIKTKMLMEYIVGRKIPFTSGDRANNLGSNRHHTNGASYAFDLDVRGGTAQKVLVAAAWKYAAQTFGYPASVGMKYKKSPTMVHVDTKRIGRGQYYSWAWGGGTNAVGDMVLRYYGRKKQYVMPYTVLASALKGRVIRGTVDTGTFNGIQTNTLQGKYGIGGSVQPYQTLQARQYGQLYNPNYRNMSYGDEYYSPSETSVPDSIITIIEEEDGERESDVLYEIIFILPQKWSSFVPKPSVPRGDFTYTVIDMEEDIEEKPKKKKWYQL